LVNYVKKKPPLNVRKRRIGIAASVTGRPEELKLVCWKGKRHAEKVGEGGGCGGFFYGWGRGIGTKKGEEEGGGNRKKVEAELLMSLKIEEGSADELWPNPGTT